MGLGTMRRRSTPAARPQGARIGEASIPASEHERALAQVRSELEARLDNERVSHAQEIARLRAELSGEGKPAKGKRPEPTSKE